MFRHYPSPLAVFAIALALTLSLPFVSHAKASGVAKIFNKGIKSLNIKNYKKSAPLLFKAARAGNAKAQFVLGWLYENGIGVERNDKKAFKWFRKAAEQGNIKAQFRLGLFYDTGRGVKKNTTVAQRWLCMAAEMGSDKAFEYLIERYFYKKEEKLKKELLKQFREEKITVEDFKRFIEANAKN